MPDEVDTFNAQFVGSQGEFIVVMNPKLKMTKAEALCYAAWIVVQADMSDNHAEFHRVLAAVENT